LEPNTYTNALDHKIKYNKVINQCVNYELRRQYGLMGYSDVEFCTTSKDHRKLGMQIIKSNYLVLTSAQILFLDSLDNTFIVITALLIIVVTLASIFDVYLERKDSPFRKPGTAHYTKVVPIKSIKFSLTIFSKRFFRLCISSQYTKYSLCSHFREIVTAC
jgi:hypothetical protein